MAQCSQHSIDVRYEAKDLYLSLTIAKILETEIFNPNLSNVSICFGCHSMFNNLNIMKQHFETEGTGHSLFLFLCPMRIICVNCQRIFNCTSHLIRSIIDSLPSYPVDSPPIGFNNLGNSCYSNATLIALSHCRPLVIASSLSHLPLMKVFNVAATTNRSFNQIFYVLTPKFSPIFQEDAAEFLLYVLDLFSKDPNGKTLFNGSTKTHFYCNHCHHHSEIEQVFTVLNLPLNQDGWQGKKKVIPSKYLPRGYGNPSIFHNSGDGSFGNHVVSFLQHFSVSTLSLEFSLQSFFSPNNSLKQTCEKCNSYITMSTTLHQLPEILVVHIGRFGKRWFGLGKMYQSVSFPDEDADFSQFVPSSVDCGPSVYSLIAVVIHNGFMSSGHYQCYARKFGTKQWYLFNDNEVTRVTREEVINSQCYLLFYQKKPTVPVLNIRQKLAMSKTPLWATAPIQIFSNPKLWIKSIPAYKYKRKPNANIDKNGSENPPITNPQITVNNSVDNENSTSNTTCMSINQKLNNTKTNISTQSNNNRLNIEQTPNDAQNNQTTDANINHQLTSSQIANDFENHSQQISSNVTKIEQNDNEANHDQQISSNVTNNEQIHNDAANSEQTRNKESHNQQISNDITNYQQIDNDENHNQLNPHQRTNDFENHSQQISSNVTKSEQNDNEATNGDQISNDENHNIKQIDNDVTDNQLNTEPTINHTQDNIDKVIVSNENNNQTSTDRVQTQTTSNEITQTDGQQINPKPRKRIFLFREIYEPISSIMKEASALAGGSIIREETEQDEKNRLIAQYPESKTMITITANSAENLYRFMVEKGERPTLHLASKTDISAKKVGDKCNFLISRRQTHTSALDTSSQQRNENDQSPPPPNQNDDQNNDNEVDTHQNNNNNIEVGTNMTNPNSHEAPNE